MRRLCDVPLFHGHVGGSFINVDVSYQGQQRTEFFRDATTCSLYTSDESHPIRVGDLVVFQGTLHMTELFATQHTRVFATFFAGLLAHS